MNGSLADPASGRINESKQRWALGNERWLMVCFFFSRGFIHHVSRASSDLFSSASWYCLPVFTPQLPFQSTPIRLHIRHVRQHAGAQPRAAAPLQCGSCPPGGLRNPRALRRGREMYLPTWQLFGCTHLYPLCPLPVTLHFSHFHALLEFSW